MSDLKDGPDDSAPGKSGFPADHERISAKEESVFAASNETNLEEKTLLRPSTESPTLLPTSDTTKVENQLSQPYISTWESLSNFEGQTLGNYHKVERVGSWRYGSILAAEHSQLRRKVRLITLESPWSENLALKTWFLSRSRAIAKIHNISLASSILEYIETGNVLFISIPAPDLSTKNILLNYSDRAPLDRRMEPFSHVYRLLLEGLDAFHSEELIHGSIDSRHISIGDSNDEIHFDPFATGIPGCQFIDESGSEIVIHQLSQQADHRQLARAFIAVCTAVPFDNLPKRIRHRWISKHIPFIPIEFSKLLARISSNGLKPNSVENVKRQLDFIRHAPISYLDWYTRALLLLGEAISFFIVLLLALLVVAIGPSLLGNQVYSFIDSGQFAYHSGSLLLAIIIAIHLFISFIDLFRNRSTLKLTRNLFLLNPYGKKPSWSRRLLRSFARSTLWIFCASIPIVVLLLPLYAIILANGTFKDNEFNDIVGQGWSYALIILMIFAPFMAYATAFLLGGQPFHDWISGTSWFHFSGAGDGPDLKLMQSERIGTPQENSAVPTLALSELGDSVDGIKIEEELGRGGMGAVYRGVDEMLQRPIALKVITANSVDVEEIIERFRREAQLGSVLQHPNIARVYRVGLWQNRPYMAMEYVDGETLQQIVKREGPLSIELAWKWIRQAAIGLEEASHHGIIHRDIKPANLMVTRDGVVKLMDFGIAKSLSNQESEKDQVGTKTNMSFPVQEETIENGLTRAGSLLGTPQYMSPEQVRSEEIDHRSDIYSLGLTLYFLLAGKPAFDGPGVYDLMLQQCTQAPPKLTLKTLTAFQHEILGRLLAKSKNHRFQSYAELIDALDRSKPEAIRLPSNPRRIAAVVIDYFVFSIGLGMLQTAILLTSVVIHSNFSNETWLVSLGVPLTQITASLCYYAGSLVWLGGTPGHLCMGLRVLRQNGNKVRWREAVLRFFAKYPALIFSVVLSLPILNSIFPTPADQKEIADPTIWTLIIYTVLSLYWFASYLVVNFNNSTHRKAIHDLVAGTRIVHSKPSLVIYILQIFDLDRK